jgi:hypothetical protein
MSDCPGYYGLVCGQRAIAGAAHGQSVPPPGEKKSSAPASLAIKPERFHNRGVPGEQGAPQRAGCLQRGAFN